MHDIKKAPKVVAPKAKTAPPPTTTKKAAPRSPQNEPKKSTAAPTSQGETALEKTMRLAFAAAGVSTEAEFKKLPKEEQNAFLSQASGSQRPEAIAAETAALERSSRAVLKHRQCVRSPWNRKHFNSEKMEKLVDSVRKNGVLQEIIVRPRPFLYWTLVNQCLAEDLQNDGMEMYEIVAGERRWQAAQIADVPVPARIREMTDEEAIEIQAVENREREDPNAIEEAEKYAQLLEVYAKQGLDKGAAMERLCERLRVSRSAVYDGLRLLRLPDEVKEATMEGRLPASHAVLIATLEHNRDVQLETALAVMEPWVKSRHRPWMGREDDEREDEDQKGVVLSARVTKALVKMADAYIANLAVYNKTRDELVPLGWRELSELESLKIINCWPRGGWSINYDHSSRYVAESDTCSLPGADYRQYSKLWKKPPIGILGRATDGSPAKLYDKKAADKAVQEGGKLKKEAGGRASSKSPAELQREREHRQRTQVFSIALKRLGESQAAMKPESEELLRIIAGSLLRSGHADALKRLCKARGWTGDRSCNFSELLAPMKAPELRAVMLQYVMADTAAPSNWGEAKWNENLLSACKLHGLSLDGLGEEIQTPGKGKRN